MSIFVELILGIVNDTFFTFLSHFEDSLLLCRLKKGFHKKKPELKCSGFLSNKIIQQSELFSFLEFYRRIIRFRKVTTLGWLTSPLK